ncbi:AraC family transcriptional regulator [Paenibacillus lemnae]|uniref:AraC family transcriptional regulator n=1 Tax=Paenibacillus lemnae TaxID=1330551 RepID=A0A848M4J1_PAELE|nr:AraC family transcriptional regulator [Paenibacillus lemnae]NMO95837.1 AraC family transcriptional regulator [Paenibacillus lemnae]
MDTRLPIVPYEAADIGEIICGHITADHSYGVRRPQGRGDLLLVYTLRGQGYFLTPGGRKTTRAHELCLLREYIPHEYGTVKGEQEWEFLWIHFRSLQEIGYLPQEEVLAAGIPEGYARQRVLSAYDHVFYHAGERSDYWYSFCENSIREMILLLARQFRNKRDPRIVETLQTLSQSMHNQIRVKDLAAAARLSVSRFSHLFKQETGEGIIEYVNRMRITQAASMMEHMDRTAAEAAQDVGFNNYNHFAALFRKQFGVSPRSYKSLKKE